MIRLLAGLGIFILTCPFASHANIDTVRNTAHMPTYGPAATFKGARDFCDKHPQECLARGSPDPPSLSVDHWDGVLAKHDRVNRAIEYARDIQGGVEIDDWNLLSLDQNSDVHLQGDCEEYAILKRHLLMREGMSSSTLLITVVISHAGAGKFEGHALLTVRTKEGDFYLDNETGGRFSKAYPWYTAPHIPLMMQSPKNPQEWVWLHPAPYTDTRVSWWIPQ